MRRAAVKLRIPPGGIKAVVLARKCSISKAVKILETLLNLGRESRFDF